MIEKRLQKTKTASVEQFQNHLGAFVGWLSGFELIKNFSIETIIYKKFNKENEEVINKLFLFKRTTNLAKTITAFLSYMSHFVIIAVTIFLVLRNEFSAGEFFIAVGLIDQLSYPIIAVSVLLQEFLSTKPLAHKMGTKFVVQTSTADGYTFNNDTYGPDVNVAGYTPSTTGEFTIGADDKMGFRTIVTNAKEEPVITEPFQEPTEEPTQEPTVEPTLEPTVEPTLEPTVEPTVEPTSPPWPTPAPTPTTVPATEQTDTVLQPTQPAQTDPPAPPVPQTPKTGEISESVWPVVGLFLAAGLLLVGRILTRQKER